MLNNDGHRAVVAALPVGRLLTETDGPFTKRNGVAARPRDVGAVVASLAAVRQLSPTTMRNLIARNLRTLVEVG